jgi:hypothetical protein
MPTTTKRRSLLSRLFRFLTRRKDPVAPRRPRGGDDGSAGVREPRRPNPAPPAMAASVEESD